MTIEPSLSPHLIYAPNLYTKAFGAEEMGRVPGPDGRLIQQVSHRPTWIPSSQTFTGIVGAGTQVGRVSSCSSGLPFALVGVFA